MDATALTRLDPPRRIAVLLAGALSVAAIGPAWELACGTLERSGEPLRYCSVGALVAAPVEGFALGILAGLLGRGLVDLLLLLAGAAIAGFAIGLVVPAGSPMLGFVGLLVPMAIPLALGYGVGQVPRRRRGTSAATHATSPWWAVLLGVALGASGMVVGGMPRHSMPVVHGYGTAVVELDAPDGIRFQGVIQCEYDPGLETFSFMWGVPSVGNLRDFRVMRGDPSAPGLYVEVTLGAGSPDDDSDGRRVMYDGPASRGPETDPDLATGSAVFTRLGGDGPSGSIEWACERP